MCRIMSSKHLIGGILLVTGTSIGAGMLALPVVTGEGGFLPAIFSYLVCWMFMSATGLLILELCLRMPPGANLVTLAETYLGRWGKIASWALYLFLFYSLSVAYLSGAGGLLQAWLGSDLSAWGGILLFFALSSPFVYIGAKAVDRFNMLCMAGLLISYFAFVVVCFPRVHLDFLERASWGKSMIALPIIFTSFSYQGIIPTLTTYLKKDARRLRISILCGTGITFLIYALWEFLILGIIPVEGEMGLAKARELGLSAVAPLGVQVSHAWVSGTGQVFAFFAITTSFLGVTLGLVDFLADGLKIPKKGVCHLQISALTFGPPLVISLLYPSLFLKALGFAGGIGCALLLGLLPTLMAYTARYRRKGVFLGEEQVGGGKPVLILMILFVLFELGVEFWTILN